MKKIPNTVGIAITLGQITYVKFKSENFSGVRRYLQPNQYKTTNDGSLVCVISHSGKCHYWDCHLSSMKRGECFLLKQIFVKNLMLITPLIFLWSHSFIQCNSLTIDYQCCIFLHFIMIRITTNVIRYLTPKSLLVITSFQSVISLLSLIMDLSSPSSLYSLNS